MSRDEGQQPRAGEAEPSERDRLADVAAEARQQPRALADGDDLARDQKVPASRPGQHAVVHEPRCARREQETAPQDDAGYPAHASRRAEVVGNRRERLVDAERHVPRLACEDEEHSRRLDSNRGAMEEANEEEDGRGEEPQNRDGLQHVERRQDQAASERRGRGPVTRAQGKPQRERIGRKHPQQ